MEWHMEKTRMLIPEKDARQYACPFRQIVARADRPWTTIGGSPPCLGSKCMLWQPMDAVDGNKEPHGICGA